MIRNMRHVWHSIVLLGAGLPGACMMPTEPIVLGGMQDAGIFLDAILSSNLWPTAAPLLVAATVLPMLVARIFGPNRSWYPVRTSVLFVLAYLLFMGAFVAVVLCVEGWCEWLADAEDLRGLLVFFWPGLVASGLPLLALAILGVHLWARSAAAMVYAVALLIEGIVLVIAVAVDWDPLWDQPSWMVGQFVAGVGLMVLAYAKRTSGLDSA